MYHSKELTNLKSKNGLHMNVVGEGEVIVFLHGGPGSEHRFFSPHVLPLAQRFKLVFYDQRGCGKSEPAPNNQYTMMEEVEALESIRQEIGARKINVFGESWGSMLALLYATTYPERVNKMFLTAAIGVTANGFTTFAKELEKRVSDEDKQKLFYLDEKMKTGKATVEEIFEILDKYYVYSEESLKRKEKTSNNPAVNHAIGMDIMQNYDLTEKLHLLKEIPILVAQGTNDILIPARIKELLLDYIPHAELVEVEECGHWSVVEQPAIINRLANEFFGGGRI